MDIKPATTAAIRYACIHFHYAHRVPSVVAGYNIYNDSGDWCGVICYGGGANPRIGEPYGLSRGQAVELVRVALNGKQGHGHTSQAVAMSLKALHREYPCVKLVVSYADIDQGHLGKIYQATNWVYVGTTAVGGRKNFIINGKKLHPKTLCSYGYVQSLEWLREHVDPNADLEFSKGKRKYLYPLDKRTSKRIKTLSQPYPT